MVAQYGKVPENTMTHDNTSSITDESEFHTKLEHLFQRAHSGGVSVEGSWPCLNEGVTPSWDIQVIRLEKDYTEKARESDGETSD